MAADAAALEGYFKDVFESLERATPNWAILQKKIPFQAQKRLGENYNFPVKLRHSHGVTFAGSTLRGTAFTLNEPKSLVMKNAQLQGTTIVVQEDIPYDVLSTAQSSGQAAYGDALDEVVFGVRESTHFYLEMMLLHGQGAFGIGAIETVAGASTSRDWDITVATWAPGLWAAMEGSCVDVYDTTGVTKRNANADVVIGAITGDPGTRQLAVTGDATDLTAIVATDIIIPKMVSPTEWDPGLRKIFANTSGTIHNISAATYSLWRANQEAAGGVKLSMALVQQMLTSAMVRGLEEKVCALVSPYSWSDINNDLSALRRYVSETKTEMQLGTKSIKFWGVTGAEVELMSHPMMFSGDGMAFPEKRMRRVGSSDVTNKLEGRPMAPENFYQDLETKAAVRIRSYANQAIVAKLPSRCTLITGVVPTAFA